MAIPLLPTLPVIAIVSFFGSWIVAYRLLGKLASRMQAGLGSTNAEKVTDRTIGLPIGAIVGCYIAAAVVLFLAMRLSYNPPVSEVVGRSLLIGALHSFKDT
jgi:uncharacterized membrane protein required for colicin V production